MLLSFLIVFFKLLKINKLPLEEFIDVVSKHVECEKSIASEIASLTDCNLQQALHLGMNIVDGDNFQLFCSMMRCAYRLAYFANKIDKTDFDTADTTIRELTTLGREKQKNFLTYSLNLIRKCVLLSCNAEQLVKMPDQEDKWVHDFAPFVNATNGHYMVEAFNNALNDIAKNGNPMIVFTDLLFLIGQIIRVGDPRLNRKNA